MNLLEMLTYYLQHQEEVCDEKKRKYDLNKAQERSHILERTLKKRLTILTK